MTVMGKSMRALTYLQIQVIAVHVDNKEKSSGKLLEDWKFEQETMPDPKDKKPKDWVDESEIPDPEDVKPADWDDIPAMIPDPDAEEPEDWDVEDDGEWEPPMIDNPEYQGEWSAKVRSLSFFLPLYKTRLQRSV